MRRSRRIGDADDVVADDPGTFTRAVLLVLEAALPLQHRPAVEVVALVCTCPCRRLFTSASVDVEAGDRVAKFLLRDVLDFLADHPPIAEGIEKDAATFAVGLFGHLAQCRRTRFHEA